MTAVILNPNSGSVSATEELVETIESALPGSQVLVSENPGEAAHHLEGALSKGCNVVVAAGGDGTLNKVLEGVMLHRENVRLGLLPLGTGNDFARTLELPTNVGEALQILSAGKSRPVDVVRVSGGSGVRHFLNISAGGFSGMVSEKVTTEVKAAWGPLAYIRGLMEALPELKPYACELTFDNEPACSLSVFNLSICNGIYVAKGIPIAPDADPSDGLLDVVAIRETPGARLALLAPVVLAKKHLESEDVFFRRAQKITVRAKPPMLFNIDGELYGDSPLTFELLPHAVEFIARA